MFQFESLIMQDVGSSSLKRRLQIVDLVRKEGEVRVEALCEVLGVSTVTIRSDLTYLEQQGYVVRTFGKARYNPALLNASSLPQEVDNPNRALNEAKVARFALHWIDDGLSMFFGSGKVVHKIIPQLIARTGLTLTLHDLSMVTSARQFLNCEIHVTGGVVRDDEPGLVGPGAEMGLKSHPIDLCVIEALAIDAQGRILCRQAGAARIYAAAVSHAKKTIALASSHDLTATKGFQICTLRDVDGFVVDHDIGSAVFDVMATHELSLDRKSDGLIEFKRQTDLDQHQIN